MSTNTDPHAIGADEFGLTVDQQIRAAALQAAARMGVRTSVQGRPDAYSEALARQVVTTARMFEAYIRDGATEATR